jgi:hypothetical protein
MLNVISSLPLFVLNKLKAYNKLNRKSFLLLMVITLVSIEPGFVIDGVTAATTVTPPAPKLILTATTPAIVNNKIRSKDGQPISIDISGTDSDRYASVVVGMVQNNTFYTDQNGLTLPPGASLVPDSNYANKATFNWTPPTGTSTSTPTVTLKFRAHDTYWNTSRTQTVTINVEDNVAPTFDEASMAVSQSVAVDTPLSVAITANPDSDQDNVSITANGLPKGAKLSNAKKNQLGQWVSQLKWTPTLDQIGKNAITFTAVDDKLSPAQTTYPIDFVVGYVAAPAFDATMQNVQSAVVNKALKFPLIVNADKYSKHVSIASDTLLPPGAKLSPAKLVKGKWVATMTWKPTAAQLGTSFPVTFSTLDPAAGSIAPVTFNVTFNVNAN